MDSQSETASAIPPPRIVMPEGTQIPRATIGRQELPLMDILDRQATKARSRYIELLTAAGNPSAIQDARTWANAAEAALEAARDVVSDHNHEKTLADIQRLEDRQKLDLIDRRVISLTDAPPEPVTVFRLNQQRVSTQGNLTVIQAQAKGGKSAVVGVMLSTLIATDINKDGTKYIDTFGFSAEPSNGKAVMWFDTEQSPYDAYRLLLRAARRAGVGELPLSFRGHYMLDIPTEERLLAITAAMRRAEREQGGIHAVIIDGVGDLCVDVNDGAEANGLVDELIGLTIAFSTPIIVVLHENPGTVKTRGHLGSQLTRKAETNLRIEKRSNGVSTLYSENSRAMYMPKSQGVSFEYSETMGMHVTVSAESVQMNTDSKITEMKALCIEVFGSNERMRYTDIVETLKARMSESHAQRHLRDWTKFELIEKAEDKKYRIRHDQEKVGA